MGKMNEGLWMSILGNSCCIVFRHALSFLFLMGTDTDDILWLQGVPSIAAIYYHTELQSTHVLYCPDDPEPTEIHPRKLARVILNVLDSAGTPCQK